MTQELKHIKEVAAQINTGTQPELTADRITWFVGDILRVLLNIHETSPNLNDRHERILELSHKTGIGFNELDIF